MEDESNKVEIKKEIIQENLENKITSNLNQNLDINKNLDLKPNLDVNKNLNDINPLKGKKFGFKKDIKTPIQSNDMNMIQDMKVDGEVDKNVENLRNINANKAANEQLKKHGTCSQCIIF